MTINYDKQLDDHLKVELGIYGIDELDAYCRGFKEALRKAEELFKVSAVDDLQQIAARQESYIRSLETRLAELGCELRPIGDAGMEQNQ